jgi:hypothetical protein
VNSSIKKEIICKMWKCQYVELVLTNYNALSPFSCLFRTPCNSNIPVKVFISFIFELTQSHTLDPCFRQEWATRNCLTYTQVTLLHSKAPYGVIHITKNYLRTLVSFSMQTLTPSLPTNTNSGCTLQFGRNPFGIR